MHPGRAPGERWGNLGRREATPAIPSAREGRSPFRIWKPACAPVSTHPASGPVRRSPLPLCAGRAGTLIGTAGAASTPDAWSQPLRQHGRRNHSRRGRTDQDLARFPHGVKPAPYPASRDRQTARPLERSRRRWVRDLDQATPSLSHAPSDRFSSRLARPQPTTARVRRPSRSAACFPAGSAAPRSAAATPRRAYGIPHGCGRARPDPCTPRCGRTC